MYFLLNLSHFVKSYEHLCEILVNFTMPTHQIWSCHVTQVATFKNVQYWLNSTFNFRESHKISSGAVLYFRSYEPKSSQGVENAMFVQLWVHLSLLRDFSRNHSKNLSSLFIF